jgi:hypothetical protein
MGHSLSFQALPEESRPELFGSRTEVEKVMEELVRRLEETRAAYPGIEDRSGPPRTRYIASRTGCPSCESRSRSPTTACIARSAT